MHSFLFSSAKFSAVYDNEDECLENKISNPSNMQTKMNSTFSPIQAEFDVHCSFSSNENQISFDAEIHNSNADIVWEASVQFLSECLIDPIDKEFGFKDPSLYNFLSYSQEATMKVHQFIEENKLLRPTEKKLLALTIREHNDLHGLLKHLNEMFNEEITEELILVIFKILELKQGSFKAKQISSANFLPRFDCFYGFDDEIKPLHSSSPVYEDVSQEETIQFSEIGMKKLAEELYFSKNLQFLNLSSIKKQVNPKTNLIESFTDFMTKISKAIFLDIAGIAAYANQQFLDLSRQNSQEIEEEQDKTTLKKTHERPSDILEQDQEILDGSGEKTVNKKLKFE